MHRRDVSSTAQSEQQIRSDTSAATHIQWILLKFMNIRIIINMSATTDALTSPHRQAMQMMTNQSY